ncbi:MAG: IclR family transcriptional regulator [Streptomycetales bacterium]
MRSVVTVFRILDGVADRQPVGVSELARLLDLPKSTTQRGLNVLHDLGWIYSDESDTRRWSLTTKALSLGSKARELDLREVALPVMHELQSRTGENVHLAVAHGAWIVLIEKVDGSQSVRTFERLGAVAPIYASATGKAILAHSAAEDVQAVIDHGLETYTEHTITTAAGLHKELQQIRTRGYAVNRGEWRADISAVGAVLLDSRDRPAAAISLSVPAHRLPASRVPSLGRLVRDATQGLTVRG